MPLCRYAAMSLCRYAAMPLCRFAAMPLRRYAATMRVKQARVQVFMHAFMILMQVHAAVAKAASTADETARARAARRILLARRLRLERVPAACH